MKQILVVDDDALVVRTISLTLERSGFGVVAADGGLSGLAALEAARFDVMIVDVFMPQMRGFQSIELFHQRAPTIPLIAISGYALGPDARPASDVLMMAIGLGATRCLRKPFTPAALLTAIADSITQPMPHFNINIG